MPVGEIFRALKAIERMLNPAATVGPSPASATYLAFTAPVSTTPVFIPSADPATPQGLLEAFIAERISMWPEWGRADLADSPAGKAMLRSDPATRAELLVLAVEWQAKAFNASPRIPQWACAHQGLQ